MKKTVRRLRRGDAWRKLKQRTPKPCPAPFYRLVVCHDARLLDDLVDEQIKLGRFPCGGVSVAFRLDESTGDWLPVFAQAVVTVAPLLDLVKRLVGKQ